MCLQMVCLCLDATSMGGLSHSIVFPPTPLPLPLPPLLPRAPEELLLRAPELDDLDELDELDEPSPPPRVRETLIFHPFFSSDCVLLLLMRTLVAHSPPTILKSPNAWRLETFPFESFFVEVPIWLANLPVAAWTSCTSRSAVISLQACVKEPVAASTTRMCSVRACLSPQMSE